MRVWNSLDEVPTDLPRTVVTLGNFDGVHLGHRHILKRRVRMLHIHATASAIRRGAPRATGAYTGHTSRVRHVAVRK